MSKKRVSTNRDIVNLPTDIVKSYNDIINQTVDTTFDTDISKLVNAIHKNISSPKTHSFQHGDRVLLCLVKILFHSTRDIQLMHDKRLFSANKQDMVKLFRTSKKTTLCQARIVIACALKQRQLNVHKFIRWILIPFHALHDAVREDWMTPLRQQIKDTGDTINFPWNKADGYVATFHQVQRQPTKVKDNNETVKELLEIACGLNSQAEELRLTLAQLNCARNEANIDEKLEAYEGVDQRFEKCLKCLTVILHTPSTNPKHKKARTSCFGHITFLKEAVNTLTKMCDTLVQKTPVPRCLQSNQTSNPSQDTSQDEYERLAEAISTINLASVSIEADQRRLTLITEESRIYPDHEKQESIQGQVEDISTYVNTLSQQAHEQKDDIKDAIDWFHSVDVKKIHLTSPQLDAPTRENYRDQLEEAADLLDGWSTDVGQAIQDLNKLLESLTSADVNVDDVYAFFWSLDRQDDDADLDSFLHESSQTIVKWSNMTQLVQSVCSYPKTVIEQLAKDIDLDNLPVNCYLGELWRQIFLCAKQGSSSKQLFQPQYPPKNLLREYIAEIHLSFVWKQYFDGDVIRCQLTDQQLKQHSIQLNDRNLLSVLTFWPNDALKTQRLLINEIRGISENYDDIQISSVIELFEKEKNKEGHLIHPIVDPLTPFCQAIVDSCLDCRFLEPPTLTHLQLHEEEDDEEENDEEENDEEENDEEENDEEENDEEENDKGEDDEEENDKGEDDEENKNK